MEIAVYGKGGIGKSTVSANLSAAMAMQGHRVLQIGCDPKHDSTRLLMHGQCTETVLDYLRRVSREEETPEEVLHEGAFGVGCVEAGGPKPGVGCAGRGIISAFEFLDRHRVKQSFDRILYDVLGDVVCGGFAVPVRQEYADVIFLVTSGEYMSIYAANNILRGIRNFDSDRIRRVAGIIYNERRLRDEDERVRRFAAAVKLPVCVKIPRSEGFAGAERQKRPLMETEGCFPEKEVFTRLAAGIAPDMKLYEARPLSDEELETVVLGDNSKPGCTTSFGEDRKYVTANASGGFCAAGRSRSDRNRIDGNKICQEEIRQEEICREETGMHPDPVPEEPNQGRHSPRPSRLPLYGCAFNGAATTAVHLTDAVVIVHGPGACAFYTLQNITSTGRKNLFNRGILMPSALNPHFEGTDIGQTQAVFGGMDSLREKVREALDRKPGAVIVISSCVSGIIGDDIRSVEDLSTEDTPVITIAADGVLAGDYMEGIRLCMDALAERLIDPDVKPEGRRVNLINETGVSNHIEFNFRVIEDLLSQMDVEVNCRYLGDAAADQMKYFLRAPLNLLASSTEDSLKRRKWLEDAYGCRFLEQPFPIGFGDACLWLRQIGAFFGREQKAEEIIEKEKTVYQQGIRRFRPLLENRTILLTTINASLDWLLEAVVAAGMRILWIGVLNYLNQDLCVTAHPEYCGEIVSGYDWSAIRDKVRELSPDLVLSNYTSLLEEGDYIQDSLPMMPAAGFHSALPVLERWTKLLETGKEGTWKDDRALFDECYS